MRRVLISILALAVTSAAAHADPYKIPRNAYGQPDLEGVWSSMSMTVLERQPGLPLTFPTKAEEDAYQIKRRDEIRDRRARDPFGQGDSEFQAEFPMARLDGKLRTSWIVSPADGRLPYSPAGRQRLAAFNGGAKVDNPEDRNGLDRCLVGGAGAAGPPILNPFTTSGDTQIVQTKDQVAILAEMNHDVRIVRLNDKHLPPSQRQWMGDSIGWYEGDTLVVETTNFRAEEGFRAQFLMSQDARVTERFRRVSPTELRYSFEVDDPALYSAVWKGEMRLNAETGGILEYACHEGNYGLENILAGAREIEKAMSGAAAKRAAP